MKIMKTLLTLFLTLLTFVGFSQDTLYVSGTDITKNVPHGFVLGTSTTVIDTVISKTDSVFYNMSSAPDQTTFTIPSKDTNGFKYETYKLYYSLKNEFGFSGNLYVSVNGWIDTTINFAGAAANKSIFNLNVVSNDVVNFRIDNPKTGWATITYYVVNITTYIEVYNPTSVNDFNDEVSTFSLYPNPTTNNLNFNFGTYTSQVLFQLYDMSGKLLNQGQVYNNTLDVSYLPKGVYIISLNNGNQTYTERFLKQ
jgi:hypothetical protein